MVLIDFITKAGDTMATVVNTSKTEGPTTARVILGPHYCSLTKVGNLDPAKVIKYSDRIRSMLRIGHTTSKDLERLIGNLEFAAWIEPFGRPLLSFISREITPNRPRRRVIPPILPGSQRGYRLACSNATEVSGTPTSLTTYPRNGGAASSTLPPPAVSVATHHTHISP